MYYQRYTNGGNYGWIIFLLFMMFGGFRLLFALFGLVLAVVFNFFPLIIMGYFTYRFVKAAGRNRTIRSSLNMNTVQHKRFVELMVHIMMQVAKADGEISESETQTMRQFFIQQLNFDNARVEWLNDTINTAKVATDTVQALAHEFSSQFSYESQLMLLNMK